MKTFIVLIILSLFPLSMMAQWYSLDKNKKNKTAPVVQILSDDNISTVIKVDISGFELKELYAGSKLYQSIDLLSEVSTSLAGSPELPYIAKIIAIPDKAGISLEVLETGDVQTFNNIYLPPSRESWIEGQPETSYIEDNNIYSSSDIYPNNLVSIETPIVFRDFRIVRLSVYPIRYIASKKELQVTSSITVKIKYNSENVVNPKTTPTKSIAPSFEKIYKSFIFNYKSAISKFNYGTKNGKDVMLCIMPDAYVSDFQAFADWKRKSGIDIHITKFSDIGATSSNPTIIKNHISDAYHNWVDPPTYILLVGDYGVLPEKIVNYDFSFPNEDYFVEIDGNDYFPEMFVGRFPVANTNELKILINKVMSYEETPNTTNTDWFKKGICCSNNYYQSQVETKRFTADIMKQYGGFTSVDTLMSNDNCTMDLNDIIQAINNGRSFLNYRGEGWYDGWSAHCYYFSTSDVSSITNQTKLTFFTSIGCGVARFDISGNCFGEALIKLGTPTSLRGAIAFIGATSNSHTTYNNYIDKGLYLGMFCEGLETPGQGLVRGKLYMYQYFGGTDPRVEYSYRLFCILGDPSVHIWKEIPLTVNVNHTSYVPFAFSENLITVKYASSGLPVDSAQVTISGNSVFSSGFTDAMGNVTLGITPVSLDSLNIVVRGNGVYPYQGKIQVSPVSVPELSGDKKEFGLGNVFPNPFDQSTLINYSIPEAGNISLKIYDINGRLIKVLYEGKQAGGNYSVKWNGQDDSGNQINAGMYFIKLNSNGLNQTMKLSKLMVIQK
jgi:hypothetical protein